MAHSAANYTQMLLKASGKRMQYIQVIPFFIAITLKPFMNFGILLLFV